MDARVICDGNVWHQLQHFAALERRRGYLHSRSHKPVGYAIREDTYQTTFFIVQLNTCKN